MSDLLTLASSGLRSYRAALEAVGENVANANSAGFARRDVLLKSNPPGALHPLARSNAIGHGVTLDSLRRMQDSFLAADARDAASDLAQLEAATTWMTELETTLGASSASISAGLTSFFNAAESVAADPATPVTRNLFLGQADALATRMRDTAASFDTVKGALGRELGQQLSEVNALTASLAAVNGRLKRTEVGNGTSAGLMDERDRLLTDLARLVRVDVTEGARGVVAVRLGSALGPELVSGTATQRVSAGTGPGPFSVRLGASDTDVTAFVTGGSLAGVLAGGTRLDMTTASLDALATDFAATMNGQHAAGVDLTGAPGEPLFATTTARITASPANTGASAIETSVADGATLDPDGYALAYDAAASAWTLARRDGAASVTGPGPLTLDGLTVAPSGAPSHADLFHIDPRIGAAGLSLRIADPAKVAAGDAWLAGASLGNAGTGVVEVQTDASAALPALPAYRLRMATATDLDISDPATGTVLATQPYVAGAWIAGAGFSVRLSGTPAVGDSFTVAANTDGSGNAANMRRLIALRSAAVGAATFEERWERESGRVATAVADARAGAAAAKAGLTSAVAARDAQSGVDLDREAADLIRFQQAYQASARVIATARELFDTLLQVG